tara:strand:- start:1503 stop:2378 length:876 start_codon:yes stop_codon:yes gene_type:complete
MITLKEIKYFVAVSEELNFRKAAKKLNISQPPLSKQIKILEEKLNLRLFERSKRGVKITLAGNDFLKNCYDIKFKINNSIESAKKIDKGELGNLKIGFSTLASFFILPKTISNFLRIYPNVELQLKEMRTEKIITDLKEKKIDIGFAGKKVVDRDIKSLSLFSEDIVLALNKKNKLKNKKKISIKDIKNEKFILFPKSKGSLGIYDKIIEFCKKANFKPTVIQEAYEIEVILGLVSGGLGVALIPENSGLIKLNNVIIKKFSEKSPTSEIYLIMRNFDLNPLTNNFYNLSK